MQPKNKLALDWCFCTKNRSQNKRVSAENKHVKISKCWNKCTNDMCVCVCVRRNKVQEREWEEIVGC